ncbi:MAG: hypothetical protein OEZ01_01685 [Candidatus Heimdallarchaeota archaeon]|nr:hypothetical protein [Candidatus Heimdallarchaeota archaeon]MDH5644685.1 hypothetical protein [Candidatus Heimdallarchaeota archaeon]
MFFLLVSPNTTFGKTRRDSIILFIDELYRSDGGYADKTVSSSSTDASTFVLMTAALLGYEINNTLDLQHYFQSSQNYDGGFGNNPNNISNWQSTIHSIFGLNILGINASQLSNWRINNFINDTAINTLFNTSLNPITPVDLNKEIIDLWHDYIYTYSVIGYIPIIPIEFLLSNLLQMQYPNGTYPNLPIAISTINLLNLLGEPVRDVELASEYIRSFADSSGAFSYSREGGASIKATMESVRALQVMGRLDDLEYKRDIVQFLLNQQEASQGIHEVGKEVDIYATYQAVYTIFVLGYITELNAPDVLESDRFVTFPFISMILIPLVWRKRR